MWSLVGKLGGSGVRLELMLFECSDRGGDGSGSLVIVPVLVLVPWPGYSQRVPLNLQCPHGGPASSHFTRLCLHREQPLRLFGCDRLGCILVVPIDMEKHKREGFDDFKDDSEHESTNKRTNTTTLIRKCQSTNLERDSVNTNFRSEDLPDSPQSGPSE